MSSSGSARTAIVDVVNNPPSHTPASIRDVAKLARVSHQTVSRVMNDHPNVRPETRRRVLDAVVALDFQPNRAARALATSRSYSVGVLMTASPAYYGPSSIMGAVEDAARDSGYSLLLASPRDMDTSQFSAALNHLIGQGVEGIVVIAPQTKAVEATASLRKPVPVAMIQCDSGDPGLSVDNEIGGEIAARHLWDLGHRRMGLILGPEGWSESGARRRGFERVLREKASAPAVITQGDWSADSGYRAFPVIVESGCTSVFCANDQVALGFIHAARDNGLDVPGAVSVVGFDDVPEAAHYLPPLTTVHQDFDVVGRRAVDRVLSALGHAKDGSSGSRDPLRPRLIVRASTAAPSRHPGHRIGDRT